MGSALLVLIPAGPASAQGLLDLLFGSGAPKQATVIDPRLLRAKPIAGAGSVFVPEAKRGGGEAADSGGTYRTVCVRMCDGAFVPLSYATTRKNFYQDEVKCRASCGGEARLFYHRNPGGAMEDAIDLSGRVYGRLPNAFRFRKTLVEGCACRPPPWSDAERARHLSYAAGGALPTPTPAPAPASMAAATVSETKIAAAGDERGAGLPPASVAPAGPGVDPVSAPPVEPQPNRTITKKSAGAKPQRVALAVPARRTSPRPSAAMAPTVPQPVASGGGGGLFGFGGPSSMGLGAKPKYVWPGDKS